MGGASSSSTLTSASAASSPTSSASTELTIMLDLSYSCKVENVETGTPTLDANGSGWGLIALSLQKAVTDNMLLGRQIGMPAVQGWFNSERTVNIHNRNEFGRYEGTFGKRGYLFDTAVLISITGSNDLAEKTKAVKEANSKVLKDCGITNEALINDIFGLMQQSGGNFCLLGGSARFFFNSITEDKWSGKSEKLHWWFAKRKEAEKNASSMSAGNDVLIIHEIQYPDGFSVTSCFTVTPEGVFKDLSVAVNATSVPVKLALVLDHIEAMLKTPASWPAESRFEALKLLLSVLKSLRSNSELHRRVSNIITSLFTTKEKNFLGFLNGLMTLNGELKIPQATPIIVAAAASLENVSSILLSLFAQMKPVTSASLKLFLQSVITTSLEDPNKVINIINACLTELKNVASVSAVLPEVLRDLSRQRPEALHNIILTAANSYSASPAASYLLQTVTEELYSDYTAEGLDTKHMLRPLVESIRNAVPDKLTPEATDTTREQNKRDNERCKELINRFLINKRLGRGTTQSYADIVRICTCILEVTSENPHARTFFLGNFLEGVFKESLFLINRRPEDFMEMLVHSVKGLKDHDVLHTSTFQRLQPMSSQDASTIIRFLYYQNADVFKKALYACPVEMAANIMVIVAVTEQPDVGVLQTLLPDYLNNIESDRDKLAFLVKLLVRVQWCQISASDLEKSMGTILDIAKEYVPSLKTTITEAMKKPGGMNNWPETPLLVAAVNAAVRRHTPVSSAISSSSSSIFARPPSPTDRTPGLPGSSATPSGVPTMRKGS